MAVVLADRFDDGSNGGRRGQVVDDDVARIRICVPAVNVDAHLLRLAASVSEPRGRDGHTDEPHRTAEHEMPFHG